MSDLFYGDLKVIMAKKRAILMAKEQFHGKRTIR